MATRTLREDAARGALRLPYMDRPRYTADFARSWYDLAVRTRRSIEGARALALAATTALFSHCAASPSAPTRAPQPLARPAFIVGYNEAWLGTRYGTDLTRDYDSAVARRTLDAIAAAGGRAVRLWLFEGREGFVLGEGSPSLRGVDPALLAHLSEVLSMARARSLFVHLAALDGNDMPAEPGPSRALYMQLLDPTSVEAGAYEARVLAPLLRALEAHRDVVVGLDLVNEIAAPRARGYFADRHAGPRAYLARTAAFVKRAAPWLPVTASAGWDGAAAEIARGDFSGLGLDFLELHVYADDGHIPDVAAVCARARADGIPILLGELGQATRTEDDALQVRATAGLIDAARGSCFAGALAWRFDAAEPTFHFARADGSLRPAAAAVRAAAQPDR